MKHQKTKNNIIHCNLCESNSFIHLFDEVPIPKCTFSVVKCKKCGLISTRPLPDDDFLAHLYSSESYKCQTVSGTYCLDEQISSVDFTFALHKLSLISSGRKLLDVGCGVGTFVRAALDSGWDSYGIEPSTYAGAIAQGDLNDRIHQGSLASATFTESAFDVITLWYVFEHVIDPTHVLSQVHTLLKKGGIVFIAVPNAYYIFLRRRIAQLINGIPGTVHPHEHLYQYTSKTLKEFLYKTDFRFISEHSASPYMVSGPYVNFVKHLGKFAVDALFLTTGINMGGILMFGRKPL